MEDVAARFFQELANAFLAGDHAWLSNVYTYPLVVYAGGKIYLERSPEETMHALLERRERALVAGTKEIVATVLDIAQADHGRYPIRVNWDFFADSGRRITKTELRYYCRRLAGDEVTIEILEFLTRGFNVPRDPETGRPI